MMTTGAADATAAAADGLYVYCVARGDGDHPFGPIGLDGQEVYTVGTGEICAVVHTCRAEPYQSQDPEVVKGWVVAHDNVVLAATQVFGTVLPMAFDVIVRGGPGRGPIEAIAAWLDEKGDRFIHLLGGLAGKAEYGVQVLWDREAVAAWLVEHDDELREMRAEARGKPKGLAHVLGQKLAKAVRTAMEEQADLFAQQFYDRIRQCVEDVRIEKLGKSEEGKRMLLNLSCLMQEGRGDLGRVLDEIAQHEGISVRFTGPWAPYSFVGR
jgi:hypothetical protein